ACHLDLLPAPRLLQAGYLLSLKRSTVCPGSSEHPSRSLLSLRSPWLSSSLVSWPVACSLRPRLVRMQTLPPPARGSMSSSKRLTHSSGRPCWQEPRPQEKTGESRLASLGPPQRQMSPPS